MNGIDGAAHKAIVIAFCERLTAKDPAMADGWRVGKTKVLLRAPCQQALEAYRKFKINYGLSKIQGTRRRKAAKARVASLKQVNAILVTAIDAREIEVSCFSWFLFCSYLSPYVFSSGNKKSFHHQPTSKNKNLLAQVSPTHEAPHQRHAQELEEAVAMAFEAGLDNYNYHNAVKLVAKLKVEIALLARMQAMLADKDGLKNVCF